MSGRNTPFDDLTPFYERLRELIPCDGVGVWTAGTFQGIGAVPPRQATAGLTEFLDKQSATAPFATSNLGHVLPSATLYADSVSGILAIPFARTPRDYLIFFRHEVEQTIYWGGNPEKAIEALPGQRGRVGPRKSFDAWREDVRGHSQPWLDGELRTAEALRSSLLDVILHRADVLEMERRTAQESQTLLIAELNHRVKNILALIGSLVRQSRQGAETVEEFTNDIESRINAMAAAHDQLTRTGWNAASLRGLIDMEAQAWTRSENPVLTLSGPPVMLDSRAYQTVALVLHEMMTNSAKYGALSSKTGRLEVSWSFNEGGDLLIEWTERGGPPVSRPTRRGFGTVVTEQTIPFELRGEAHLEFQPEGLRARFLIPALNVSPGGDEADAETETGARVSLADKRLLLVEDSMMIALDAQNILQSAGAEVEIAGSSHDAMRALRLSPFDAAVLDINLSGETSFGVADDLIDRQRPFIFATGYGESIRIPERFDAIPIVTKPYNKASLQAALARCQNIHLTFAAE
jgi:light-regulated signal transduction histidine kinase (bacteriophytochrome)